MQRGQGWREVDDDEYHDNVAYYTVRPDHIIEYDHPSRYSRVGTVVDYETFGDYMSVVEAARIVDMVPHAVGVMAFLSTERPNIFKVYSMYIENWRLWSDTRDGKISQLRVDRKDMTSVYIHVLKDDWFMVNVSNVGYYKCDQLSGVANLFRYLLKNK